MENPQLRRSTETRRLDATATTSHQDEDDPSALDQRPWQQVENECRAPADGGIGRNRWSCPPQQEADIPCRFMLPLPNCSSNILTATQQECSYRTPTSRHRQELLNIIDEVLEIVKASWCDDEHKETDQ